LQKKKWLKNTTSFLQQIVLKSVEGSDSDEKKK